MMSAAVGSVSAAEPIIVQVAPIEQTEEYYETCRPSGTADTTVKYSSIKSDASVTVRTAFDRGYAYNMEFGNIEAGNKVTISTHRGDITLGDVQAKDMGVSTSKGNITVTGTLNLSEKGSTIAITGGGENGTIILDGADITNVALCNEGGTIAISGDTTLSNVAFEESTVEVAEGTSLTLENVAFTSFENSNNELPALSDLVLGDNVVLTLNAGDALKVKELTIGNGVEIIITLSDEAFAALDNTTFNIFSVQEGEVDLTGATVSFTDGEQTKTGTIKAEGGKITVTDSYVVPEPTTAVLSLLALCGLAARRRRI